MRYSLEDRGPGWVARRPLSTGKGGRNPGVAEVSAGLIPGTGAARRNGHLASDRGERAGRVLWRWPSRLLAPLSAIWVVPWFVTQDGPAHVYNAQILAESFDAAIAVARGLHDLVEADPELDGAPRSGRAGLVAAGVGRRSDHDQRDAGGACRGHALAAVARGRRKGLGLGGVPVCAAWP